MSAQASMVETPTRQPRLPLFRFGEAPGSPLAIVAGGLILDTGEAERTFVYRCQDRFLTYASLLGLQTVFFAANEVHVAAYGRLVDQLASRFDRICVRSNVLRNVRIREPLFVIADIDDLTLSPSRRLLERLEEPGLRSAVAAGIAMNQVSPTYARLAADLDGLFREIGLTAGWDLDGCRRMADLAMRLQDKAYYTTRVETTGVARARHLPTLITDESELRGFAGWPDLAAAFERSTGHPAPDAFFLKTSRNTSGNLAQRLEPDTMRAAIDALFSQIETERADSQDAIERLALDLAAEVAENPALRSAGVDFRRMEGFKCEQARRRLGLRILLQPALAPGTDEAGRPAGVGLSFQIAGAAEIETVAASAQLYRDPSRRQFLGAYLSEAMQSAVGPEALSDGMALCRMFAAEGYRGPISFDLFLDGAAGYRFVHDCNPRLTGVFPSLAVDKALREDGLCPASVLTLGYRGEFVLPDLDHTLSRLADAGLLYGTTGSKGIVLLPNLCRDDGYDIHLIGIAPDEARSLLAEGGALATICGGILNPKTFFV